MILMTSRAWCVNVPLLSATLLAASAAAAPVSLPNYGADISQTSVSGLSAGAYMAVQMHVAHSSIMKGVGVFAGGPYRCAEGNLLIAQTRCMSPNVLYAAPGAADLARFAQQTRERAVAGLIDDPSHLANQRAWIFVGAADDVVRPAVVATLPSYYAHFMPAENVVYRSHLPTFHNQVVLEGDTRVHACNYKNMPFNRDAYVNDCDYDAAGELLQHIYGPLNPRNGGALGGQFIEYGQHEFIADPRSRAMDDTGWAYVPASCAAGAPCRIHVAFHGCFQFTEHVGDAYVKNSGLNQWADTNGIIVLYPQTIAVRSINPNGCFDWWGYNEREPESSKIYDTRNGVQIAAVRRMIDRVAGARNGALGPPPPAGLSVAGTTDTAVSLAWSASTGQDVAGYNVYRDGVRANPAPVAGTSYVDAALQSGRIYAYFVKAVNAGNVEGAPSNAVSADTGGATSREFTSDPAEDGYVKAYADGGSPVVGTHSSIAVGRGTGRKFNRGFLSFDTSAIPRGAAITRAYLTVRHGGSYGAAWDSPAANNLVIDVKAGVFGDAAVIEPADWAAPATASAVASIPGFAGASERSGDFNAAGMAAINTGGGAKTQLRLRFSSDQAVAGYVRLLDGAGAVLSATYR